MAIKKFEDKSLKGEIEDKEIKKNKYFFSDIYGCSITVDAASPEEAEKKAKEIINKSK